MHPCRFGFCCEAHRKTRGIPLPLHLSSSPWAPLPRRVLSAALEKAEYFLVRSGLWLSVSTGCSHRAKAGGGNADFFPKGVLERCPVGALSFRDSSWFLHLPNHRGRSTPFECRKYPPCVVPKGCPSQLLPPASQRCRCWPQSSQGGAPSPGCTSSRLLGF